MALTEAEELELLELEYEAAQLRQQYEAAQRRQQDELHTHKYKKPSTEALVKARVARDFGLDPRQVDLGAGVPFGERISSGFLSDESSPAEVQAWVERSYPGAPVSQAEGYTAFMPPGAQQPTFVNPPGFETGDFGQFIGESGPATVGATGGFMTGGIPGAVAGAMSCELAREEAQATAGTQREGLLDVGLRVGLAGGLELLPGAWRLVKKGGAKALGKGRSAFGEYLSKMSEEDLSVLMEELQKNEGLTLPELFRYQKSDNPVVQRLADQFFQFSEKAQARIAQQAEEFGLVAKKAADLPELQGTTSDAIITRKLRDQYNQKKAGLIPDSDPTAGGLRTQDAIIEGVEDVRKNRMRDQYGKLDTLTEEWKPLYDISSAKEMAEGRYVPGDVEIGQAKAFEIGKPKGGMSAAGADIPPEIGPEEVAKVLKEINVAPPNQKLQGVYGLLRRLSGKQDYKTLKEIRSQVGEVLKMSDIQLQQAGISIKEAQGLYKRLTQAMLDPQNVPPLAREGIIKNTEVVNDLANEYYGSYRVPGVQEAYRAREARSPEALVKALSSDATMVPEDLAKIVDGIPDQARKTQVKQDLQAALLKNENPLEVLNTWEKDNPRALRWLFGGKEGVQRARSNAKELTWLNSSAYRRAEDAAVEEVGFALKTLRDFQNIRFNPGTDAVTQAKAVAEEVGKEGLPALRGAVLTDIIYSSMGRHPQSKVWTIDPKKLETAINRITEQGIHEGILNERDRKVLKVMEKYAKKIEKSGAAGTGLTVAAQIGQLRSGDLGAASSIYFARNMADWLTNDKIPYQRVFETLPKGKNPYMHGGMTSFLTGLRQHYGPEWVKGLTGLDEDAEQEQP